MTYCEFHNTLKTMLQGTDLFKNCTLKDVDVPRNNETLKGICIVNPSAQGEGTAPVFYTKALYKEYQGGMPIDIIAQNMIAAYQKMHTSDSMIALVERRANPENLRTAIVSYEANKEWLKDLPYERIADLAVFLTLDLDEKHFVKVNRALMDKIRISDSEAFRAAKENMASDALLSDLLLQSCVRLDASDSYIYRFYNKLPYPALVLTTAEGYDGASLLANAKVLAKIRRVFGKDFIILPSSIHELIVLPTCEDMRNDTTDLIGMVRSINREYVDPADKLSDYVYYYDGAGVKMLQGKSWKITNAKKGRAPLKSGFFFEMTGK